MNHLLSAVTGRYETAGNPADADCVQAHSFGTDGVNLYIADLAIDYAQDRLPILADRNATHPLQELGASRVVAAAGDIGNGLLEGRPGTRGALEDMFAYMAEHDLHSPLFAAHARHVSRVVLQAMKLAEELSYDIHPIVPPGLPRHLDWASKQLWTKHVALWVPYELAATVKLKRDGQL